MAKAPKAPHPEDLMIAEDIKTATEFTACLHLGPGQRHTVRGLPDYAAAMAAAAELNTKSQFGRKAIVYAISKRGYTLDVSPKLAALAGLSA